MARGSITPRPTKDGKVRYRVKWESRGPDGSRCHHSATTSTKKAAEILLAEKLAEVNDGAFIVASKEPVAQFMEQWLEASTPGWSPSTAYQNRSAVRNRIIPNLGGTPLARLDEISIQSCHAKLLADGYSTQSVASAYSLPNSALSQAVA